MQHNYTMAQFIDELREYESDTFSASGSEITREEAEKVAGALLERWKDKHLDGVQIDSTLDDIRNDIRAEARKGKRFIITDPCYIMDEKQYQEICDKQACNFEGQTFPLKSKRREDGAPIVFHTIEGTPNGDGSYTYRGQDIGVDAGMLCIAEAMDWEGERFGAVFETLEQAQKALPGILTHF